MQVLVEYTVLGLGRGRPSFWAGLGWKEILSGMEGIGGFGYGEFFSCGLWGWIGLDWIGGLLGKGFSM